MGTNRNKVNNTIYIVIFVIILVVLYVIYSLLGSNSYGQGYGQGGPLNSFQMNQGQGYGYGQGTFMNSNNMIAKIAFLFVVIFLFVLLLRVGIAIMTYAFNRKSSVNLFDKPCMIDARQIMVFSQDPNAVNPKTIFRSTDGLSFTWSTWIYIDDLQYLKGQYRHIFSKGNSDLDSTGVVQPNNAPGLYITPNTNDLLVIMNTYNSVQETITVKDVPLNKWINIIIRCRNNTRNGFILDVYINGTITKSLELDDIPKQNYGDVFTGLNGGFSGYQSNLRYWPHDLSISEIQNVMAQGPSTTMCENSISAGNKNTDYLSLRWFFGGVGDQFNPGP